MPLEHKTGVDNKDLQARTLGYVSRPTPEITSRYAKHPDASTGHAKRTVVKSAAVTTKPLVPIKDKIPMSPIATFPIPKKELRLVKRAQVALAKVNPRYAFIVLALLLVGLGSVLGVGNFKANQQIESKVKALVSQSAIENNHSTPGSKNESPVNFAAQTAYNVAPSLPKILKIPAIGVRARVKRVIADESNVIQATDNIFDVGWYEGSVKPGENGAALINGHVSGETKRGTFFDLWKLKTSDIITIERGDETVLKYTVVGKEMVDVKDFDIKKALSSYLPDKQGLNLMTYFESQPNNAGQQPQTCTVIYTVLQ